MITRRRFLERTGLFAAGISVSKLPSTEPQLTTLDPDTLTPYVDPLPVPPIAQPSGMRPSPDDTGLKLPYYRMAMREMECKSPSGFTCDTHVGVWLLLSRTDLRDP